MIFENIACVINRPIKFLSQCRKNCLHRFCIGLPYSELHGKILAYRMIFFCAMIWWFNVRKPFMFKYWLSECFNSWIISRNGENWRKLNIFSNLLSWNFFQEVKFSIFLPFSSFCGEAVYIILRSHETYSMHSLEYVSQQLAL